MKTNKEKHLGLRIDAQLHRKLRYIAEYEGRSINGQIIYLIRQCAGEFEAKNGFIDISEDLPDDAE